MKRQNSTLLLTLFLSIMSIRATAHDIAVANSEGTYIYYNWINNDTELSVSYRGKNSSTFTEYEGNVVIPATVFFNGVYYPVTSIGGEAFRECTGLTGITIPGTVRSIGNYAFWGCTGLTNMTIPASVNSIGHYAFYGCGNLADMTIPNSVTYIGGLAFQGTAWVKSQPDGIVYAGNVAYTYNGTMPSETSITLQEGTVSVTDYAFKNCTGLVSVTFPSTVKNIGNFAFRNCTALTGVTIPGSVTSIGYEAFFGCSSLAGVTIPNSVTNIDRDAFTGTIWLNNQPDGVVYAGKVAYKYKGTMPADTCITLQEGTVSIATYAFSGCTGLTGVVIPRSVTSIGNSAFEGCTGLTTVTVKMRTPVSIDENVFPNRENVTLYVPFGCKDAYTTAEYWKDFNIETTDEDTDFSQEEDIIYVEPTVGLAGMTTDLPIMMRNTMTPVGCSFMLTLPEGMELLKDSDGDVIYETGSRARKMSVTMKDWNNGSYDFGLIPSTGTATITDGEDAVITFRVQIPEDMAPGDYRLKLTKCLIQNKDNGLTTDYKLIDAVTTLTVSDYIMGDANGDRKVTPADAVMTMFHYFNVPQTGFNANAADTNKDGRVTPADAIETLYMYFDTSGQAVTRQPLQDMEPQ